MSRRDLRPPAAPYPPPPPSKCAKVLYYVWRLCSVVFAHLVMISLVVAYCILGAVAFQRLEAQHEREVKQNISLIRANTTHAIWRMTNASHVLVHANWTHQVAHMLQEFESALLLEMKVRGWDGNESTDHIQWTFTGALFYSIIVITTIGYGHIAPKTQTGKVVTILYAILGIPLMLLCLSNIGDVMASSFRFLYWRVCCYVCTRPPKRRRHPSRTPLRRSASARSVGARASLRGRERERERARGSSRRRQRPLPRAHSDTDCRYRDSGYGSGRARARAPWEPPAPPAPPNHPPTRTRSQPPAKFTYYDEEELPRWRRSPERNDKYGQYYDDGGYGDDVDDDFPKTSLPLDDLEAALRDLEERQKRLSMQEMRTRSLPRPPRPRRAQAWGAGGGQEGPFQVHDLRDVDLENYQERRARELEADRGAYGRWERGPEDDGLGLDGPPWHDEDRYVRRPEYYERDVEGLPASRGGRRARSEGVWGEREYGGPMDARPRRLRLRRLRTVDDSARHSYRYTPSPDPVDEDWSDETAPPPRRSRPPSRGCRRVDVHPDALEPPARDELKPVPIWLCAVLVGGYTVAGTVLFRRWEGWSALDAAYFCFITLTTIGFGDFVPAQGVRGTTSGEAGPAEAAAAVHSLALCALYVLVGIALLAMAFNLVQEEVRAHVAALATHLGIIKPKPKAYAPDDHAHCHRQHEHDHLHLPS